MADGLPVEVIQQDHFKGRAELNKDDINSRSPFVGYREEHDS